MRGTITYFLLLAAALGLYFMSIRVRPKQIDWQVTLSAKDKIPYGAYIFRRELPLIFPGVPVEDTRAPVYNTTTTDTLHSNSLYVYTGSMLSITETDFDALLSYIKRGNSVFLAASYWGGSIEKKFKVNGSFLDSAYADKVSVSLTHDWDKRVFTSDRQILSGYFHDYDHAAGAELLGYNSQHKLNFMRFKLGKGYMYLHACPRIFSNYFLLQGRNSEYLTRALSLVPSPVKVYWDEYYHSGTTDDRSVLTFILSDPSLKTAYAGTICLLLLFVFFEIKRKQRIIPVVEPVQNQTLAFVETVSLLYYNQKNNRDIARKMVMQLFDFIQHHYFLNSAERGEEYLIVLAAKSGITKDTLYTLFSGIAYIQDQHGSITDDALLDFNKQIEGFYSKANR